MKPWVKIKAAFQAGAWALMLLLWTGVPPVCAGVAAGDGMDVIRYSVHLTPDLATRSVAGSEDIRFRATDETVRQVAFSVNALTIDSATLNDKPVAVRRSDTAWLFDLPKPLSKGQTATLRFRFRGTPARGINALQTGLYTSYFACDWMICLQDSPGDKAKLDLDLIVPAGMQTLAAGDPLPVRKMKSGQDLHRWRLRTAYSPYLYGFAVGQFRTISRHSDGKTLRVLSDSASDDDMRYMLDQMGDMLPFLTQASGSPLPPASYAQLIVPGTEAQEAATYSLIGQDQLTAGRQDPPKDWATIHEFTHQWWGNAITSETWTDFWLNEGITTFLTAAWKERQFGHAAYEAELDIARQRFAKVRDAGWDRPLAFSGAYPSLSTRRAIQYSKGALFMDHLRTELGDEVFWQGLRLYSRAHIGGTVISRDFQRAMEQASGRDLGSLFAEWVYEP